MDIAAVMIEIGARLKLIDGLRQVHDSPPGTVIAPAAIVSFPESITFDETYARGMDRIRLPVVLVVGRPVDRSTRDAIAVYCAGSGPRSVKAVLEAGNYTAFDDMRVAGVEFDVVTIAAVDYLVAIFDLDIAGAGSA